MQQHHEVVPVLSVVMTAHNAESVLPRTLQSLIEAIGGGDERIEVVIINDSSRDRTQDIIDTWVGQHTGWSTYTVNYANVGLTKPFGIRQCRGEYITFVDDDDLLSRFSITSMVDFLQKEKPDMVISTLDVRKLNDALCIAHPEGRFAIDAVKISQNKAIIGVLQDREISNHMQGKFVKRDIYLQSPIRPYICYEDISVMPYLFMQSQDIRYCKQKIYIYIKRQNSLTWALEKDKQKARLRLECIRLIEEIFPSKYSALIACHYIDLHLKHMNNLDKKAVLLIRERMSALIGLRFFLSPHVRVSFKRKAIQELKRARQSSV